MTNSPEILSGLLEEAVAKRKVNILLLYRHTTIEHIYNLFNSILFSLEINQVYYEVKIGPS